MDSRGNIKPLSEFPEHERKDAAERLKKFQEDRDKLKEEILTDKAKDKLDKVEAKLDQMVLGIHAPIMVPVSQELFEQLVMGEWSEPVRIKIEMNENGTYEMTCMTP